MDGISIVIPTYNRARLLRPTLESVKRLQVPAGVAVELLVIDNNCTDETPQIVENAAADAPFPFKRIVETRQGLCYGRNRGLQEAQYGHVAYLDDDVDVAPEWLAGYLEAVEELDADCVVGPVTPRFEGEVPECFSQRVIDSIGSSYSRKGERMTLLPLETAHEVPGCNFAVRRVVALELGGFNNSLDRVGKGLLAGGDFEFGMRMAAADRRVIYQPKCAIRHVIDAEKLSASYMRKRWTGMGATQRVLQDGTSRMPFPRIVRYIAGVGKLIGASLWHGMRGDRALAFQRELEARRSWAFLTTTASRTGSQV